MGLELELLPGLLPPIRTAAATTARPEGHDDAVLDGCSTPTTAASLLRAPSVCPPAPRKPRPPRASRVSKFKRRCGSAAPPAPPAPVRWLIAVPHDVLAAVFVAGPATACPTSPASKKIRIQVVG